MSALLLVIAAAPGCKSTPVSPAPPPFVSATVDAEFEHVWRATRNVLLEQGLQVYVRDKRGLFVAYTPTKRTLILFPNRTKLTVTLEAVSPGTTRVAVETIRQHYRVTLLTYPDWRDATGEIDQEAGQTLLDTIVAHSKANGGAPEAPAPA